MGTKSNMKCREATAHVDDEARHQKIEKARKLIFRKGARIKGKHVKDILGLQSLVPTRASLSLTACCVLAAYYYHTECIFSVPFQVFIQFFHSVCCGLAP
jgi:hypothetical protein